MIINVQLIMHKLGSQLKVLVNVDVLYAGTIKWIYIPQKL